MNIRFFLVAWVACIAWSGRVSASERLEKLPLAPKLVQHMLLDLKKTHPDLKAAVQDLGVRQAYQQQVRQWPNPNFQLLAEDFIGTSAYTENLFTQYGLQMEQTLPWPQKRELAEQESDLLLQLSQRRYEQASALVFADVYQELLLQVSFRKKLRVLQERLQTLEQLKKLAQGRLEQGKVSKAWVLPFEQEAVRTQRYLQTQKMGLDLSQQKLGALGLPEGYLQDVQQQTLVEQIERYVDAYKAPVLQQLPEWQILHTQLQVDQTRLSQAEQERFPDLSLGGGLRYHLDQTWGGLLSFGLNVPLWHQYEGNVAVAAAQLKVDTQEKQALEERLQRLWLQEKKRLQAFEAQEVFLADEYRLLREEYTLNYQAFAAGKISQWELLRMSQRLQDIQQEEIDLQHKQRHSYGLLFLQIYPFSHQTNTEEML